MLDPEILKALEMVAEYDRQRPVIVKEYRLYYRADGSIIGLWESDFPEGKYVVLEDLEFFNTHNTHLMRVVKGKLTMLDPNAPFRARLRRSTTGQPVVKGHPAVALRAGEEYPEIEYYDRNS